MNATIHAFRLASTTLCFRRLSYLLLAVSLVGSVTPAQAQVMHHVELNRVSQTVHIDETGSADVTFEIRLPADVYTSTKSDNPSTTVMLRRLRFEPQWYEVEEVDGTFHDADNRIEISYRVPGLARTDSAGRWQLTLPAMAGLQLVATTGDAAIFTSIVETDFLGQVNFIYQVQLPAAAEALAVSDGADRVSYRLDAQEAGDDVPVETAETVDFDLDVTEQVMSCLAKAYADPRFSHLWVARTRFTNSTGRSLSDYRVRFRIPGYTLDWSPWSRSGRVVAGQAVVDAYFPQFDMAQLAKLAGPRTASLEVELEYRDHDGELVRDQRVRRVQLLGRNEVVLFQPRFA